jgi:hypothetical protein
MNRGCRAAIARKLYPSRLSAAGAPRSRGSSRLKVLVAEEFKTRDIRARFANLHSTPRVRRLFQYSWRLTVAATGVPWKLDREGWPTSVPV